MSKKARRATNSLAPRRFPWPWLAAGGALLLIVAGLLAWTSSRQGSPAPAEAVGVPKLAVDRTEVDEGYRKFDTQVRTTFRLSNVGDQPLTILGQPQVQLVEGC